jgi:hypothetical protein
MRAMSDNSLVVSFSFGYGHGGKSEVLAYAASISLDCDGFTELCRRNIGHMDISTDTSLFESSSGNSLVFLSAIASLHIVEKERGHLSGLTTRFQSAKAKGREGKTYHSTSPIDNGS